MAGLTDKQKSVLPPELRIILERFHHEPQLFMQLKQLLSLAAQKVAQQAINHNTFCDIFTIPNKLPQQLLKLYGMTEKEFQAAMAKIGFDFNRMYKDIYYQTLTVAYLVGLDFDDKNIRRLSLLLIAIRIWNGRKYKSFPSFCDPDIAKYVLNYELKGNHTFKMTGHTPFEFLDAYSVPAVDDRYHDVIANNLNVPNRGLRLLIETMHSRINQVMRSMRDAYYRVHKEGKKELTAEKYGQQYGTGDTVEQKESFSGNIERLVDKIEKNGMLKKNVILKPEAQAILKRKFNISETGIRMLNDWIEHEENTEEFRYFIELLFNAIKPRDESDICKYDVHILATRVTSSKKDPNLIKAKEILYHMLSSVLGEKYKTLGRQRIEQLKLAAAYALVVYIKSLLCKKI